MGRRAQRMWATYDGPDSVESMRYDQPGLAGVTKTCLRTDKFANGRRVADVGHARDGNFWSVAIPRGRDRGLQEGK
jgi:hypothetical protein